VIRAEIEHAPGVDALLDLRTMHVGPEHLIVAARVAFSDEISADRAEDVADDIDRRLCDRLPLVPHIFLDPTQIPPAPGLRAGVHPAPLSPAIPGSRGAADSRAAHSSIPACTKAWGRLPRNWRW